MSLRDMLKARKIQKRTETLRKAYEGFNRSVSGYSCGIEIALTVSSTAYDSLTTMVHLGKWLIDNDPDCPVSMVKQVDEWERFLNKTT